VVCKCVQKRSEERKDVVEVSWSERLMSDTVKQ
jgi:hypothetical protein